MQIKCVFDSSMRTYGNGYAAIEPISEQAINAFKSLWIRVNRDKF